MDIRLPQNAWFGDESITITLPRKWRVEHYTMAADRKKPLTVGEIKQKFSTPIGTDCVKDSARGKNSAVIVFDDMSRPTPVQILAEIILEELLGAGIPKHAIRFVCALGTHGALTRIDFEKKLGSEILKEYGVFNHNPYENCQKIGVTSNGTVLLVNAEVVRCDIKIGIGNISPHPVNGFGGGGKIIFPGVSAIETIEQLHIAAAKHSEKTGLDFISGVGNLDNQGMRNEIEEGVRMIGLDFIANALLNSNREIIDLYVGDPIEAYYQGVRESAKLHAIEGKPGNKDIVIVNAHAKANEAAIALGIGAAMLKDGGDIVVVNHIPSGQVVHYLGAAFGYQMGGRMWPGAKRRYANVNKTIFFTPYPDYSSAMSFGDPSGIIFAEKWNEVLALLSDHGDGCRVGVITDGTMQYYAGFWGRSPVPRFI